MEEEENNNKKEREMEELEKTHDDDDDIISSLPEPLIQKIMTLLSFEDATRLSMASKMFIPAYKSIPTVDFDCVSFCRHSTKRYSLFPDFVEKSLELLTHDHGYANCFERLNFVYQSARNWQDLVDKIIHFSLRNKIKELNLTDRDRIDFWKSNWGDSYFLPESIFSSHHVTRLKIVGFRFKLKHEKSQLVLRCPLIEEISLTNCSGFETVSLSGDKLKHVALAHVRLTNIAINPLTTLESFSCLQPSPCVLRIQKYPKLSFHPHSFMPLKFLELRMPAVTTDEWIKNLVSYSNCLETLKLHCCNNLKNVCFGSDNLKTLVLRGFYDGVLESIHIVAPNLESFEFGFSFMDHGNLNKVNINSSKNLKSLKLKDARLSDEWVEDNFVRFVLLENLKMARCKLSEKLEFSCGKLKRLNLKYCSRLSLIEIRAPNLVSLIYNVMFLRSPPLLISSSTSRLRAKLTLYMLSPLPKTYHPMHLWNFIRFFNHCHTLEIRGDAFFTEALIYGEDTREAVFPPLCDLKHLYVELNTVVTVLFGKSRISELVEWLLWHVWHPETISIAHKDVHCLKFRYECEDKVSSEPCAVTCWQHSLVEVEMENFSDSKERSSLQNFLIQNTKGLTNIICT